MNDAKLSPAKIATASKTIADIVQKNLFAIDGEEVSVIQIEQGVKSALK